MSAARAAAQAVPPAWPLSTAIAVNPFLGQCGESFAGATARLARVAGAATTMPRQWYDESIKSGLITDADLAEALAAAPIDQRPAGPAALKAAAKRSTPAPEALPTVAELAARNAGLDWPGIVEDRIGAWAAGYFDAGQALWSAPRGRSAYAAWRSFATHDLTPEIMGLRGFAARVDRAPDSAAAALECECRSLGLEDGELENYFHRLLMTLGGWSQYARGLAWQAELAGERDDTLIDLLAIRIIWEAALYERHARRMEPVWKSVRGEYAKPMRATGEQMVDIILQDAAERAVQRRLGRTLAETSPSAPCPRPDLQAVFCIDVRSEVLRRALEDAAPGIQTLGFAGFFGLPVSHRRFASDVGEHRLPALLQPSLCSRTGGSSLAAADRATRVAHRAVRAWGRFKLAAVSSFAFVEAAGPIYIVKLLRDALGLARPPAHDEPAPRFDPEPAAAEATRLAESVLRAMSLTDGFGRLVLLVGHAAGIVNNPHASALHCGACGGHGGDVNARLLAGLLNDEQVREGLAAQGIDIPSDTLFVAALHDTTTDEVRLYDTDQPANGHAADLDRLRGWLAAAGERARAERIARLPFASGRGDIPRRGRDWSQIRPEWALAGCRVFVAAPRQRTRGLDLQGRAFLHEYDWRRDHDFGVLELILTAPVVVASWISLQYYGSTVAPHVFGAGNKLLHNVTGGIGVVEGNGGALRTGLPWQSVHDGEALVHQPLRLSVVIEAPHEAVSEVLRRHPSVLELFDNGWASLLTLDERGALAWRYAGGLRWRPTGYTPQANECASILEAMQ
ncbi:MAG: DUF2309 domain-containing protein [Gammaproteobacteria bacterium]|nr:DUF2309 domain-containing protein [Gammaproteobacteria bacterium]